MESLNEAPSTTADASSDNQFLEKNWAAALSEFDGPDRRSGLWAKLLVKTNGNEVAAKIDYLKLRVKEIELKEKEMRRAQVVDKKNSLVEMENKQIRDEFTEKILDKSYIRFNNINECVKVLTAFGFTIKKLNERRWEISPKGKQGRFYCNSTDQLYSVALAMIRSDIG